MYVAVSILPKSVTVTQLTEHDGQLVSTDNMLELEEGMKIGYVPYERLRMLGDGVHELSETYDAIPHAPREDGHIPWGGWLFFAVVSAAAAFLGYWMFADWEAEGGRMRIHWIVALVYAIGGKWAVAGAFGGGSVVLLGQSMRVWFTGLKRLDEKRRRLADNLAEIMDSFSRITVGDYTTRRGLFVGHDEGRLSLYVPVDFLTAEEEKRSRKQFGDAEQGRLDPDFPEVTPPSAFSVELDSDPATAAERVIEVLQQVYGLHPYFDLDVHSHVSWSNDQENNDWQEAADEMDDEASLTVLASTT